MTKAAFWTKAQSLVLFFATIMFSFLPVFNRFLQLSFAWLVLLLKLLGCIADDMTTIIMDTDIGLRDGQKIHTTVTNLIRGIITTIGELLDML